EIRRRLGEHAARGQRRGLERRRLVIHRRDRDGLVLRDRRGLVLPRDRRRLVLRRDRHRLVLRRDRRGLVLPRDRRGLVLRHRLVLRRCDGPRPVLGDDDRRGLVARSARRAVVARQADRARLLLVGGPERGHRNLVGVLGARLGAFGARRGRH